jgi:hypothetical protein
MRILFDRCVPRRRLKKHVPDHQIRTNIEMFWDRLRNGLLLSTAATHFDVFLTVDANIKH